MYKLKLCTFFYENNANGGVPNKAQLSFYRGKVQIASKLNKLWLKKLVFLADYGHCGQTQWRPANDAGYYRLDM